MITVTCTEKIRDKNNRIVGYELKDCNGKKMKFTSEQVKQAVFLQQITVKNLKLTSDGRLIDNTESAQSDGQLKSAENNQLALINKLKNMKCYQIMQLSIDDIAHIIEKMSNIKLEEIPFADCNTCDTSAKLYFYRCMPFLITKRIDIDCKYCYENKTDEKTDKRYCCISIPFPTDSTEYQKYNANGFQYKRFDIHPTDVNRLVHIASIWKSIPNTKISYEDIAYALYELMLKYVDTKYATINNVIKLHSTGITDTASDFSTPIIQKEQTGLSFHLRYVEECPNLEDVIEAELLTVVMYLTNEGYNIHIVTYTQTMMNFRYCISGDEIDYCKIVVGFNGDLKNTMRKIKLIIDDKFKSALKEVKDLAKEIKHKYKNV